MKYWWLCILTLLFSCTAEEPKEAKDVNATTAPVEAELDYWAKNNCLRGVPTSTLYSKGLKRYNFELQKDKGVELAVWENGDSLIVENRGCEVFWLTYTFYVNNKDLQEDHLRLVRYCFEKVEQIDLAPIDLKGGMNELDKMLANQEKIEFGLEYFLKEDNVSEMFEVDEIDLMKNKSKVVFSYAIGNL